MKEHFLLIWKPALEIIILWFALYRILLFVKGTRAAQVLKGIIILIILFFVTQRLGLETLSWILTKLFALSIIAFLIIFHPELRRGLARLGQNHFLGSFLKEEQIIEEIATAALNLSQKKTGALIAIEREVGLKPFIESGVSLHSKLTHELLSTIFVPNAPMHDGGVIISEGQVAAAGCLFPLSQNPRISKTLGTRHRAALGLTEETDAVVVVISEETGAISVAIGGKLTRDLNREGLTKILTEISRPHKREINT